MASTRFNVQVSTHAYSFQITVPSSVTVLELKNRIAETCPGQPDRSGQRIIWQGRVIDDTSVIADVWTGADEHTIHLAVNPSAWRSSPPNSAPPPQPKVVPPAPVPGPSESAPPPPIVAPSPTPFTAIRPPVLAGPGQLPPSSWLFSSSPTTPQPPTTFMPAPPPYSMAFIHHSHANALRVLCRLPLVPWWGGAVNELATAKGTSRQAVETSGATWPTILELDYPTFSVSEPDGVQYAIGFNDGLPYLFLQTPDVPPSAAQRHAMRVLEATMPLLDQAPLVHAQATLQVQSALQATLLARTAFNQPVVARQPARPAVAAFGVPAALQPLAQVQIRAIIPPLVMLVFRAGLLLYIFTPSRRPLFAAMIGLWVAWEVYTVVRAAMPADVRAPRRAAAHAAAANGAANGAAPGAAAANGANGAAGAPTRLAFMPEEPGVDALARLATIQLGTEAAMLEPGAEPAQVPDWRQRTRAFLTLFVLSVHPAWWERRRRLLRNREGQLRTRYRQPEPPAPEPAADEQNPDQPPREPPPPPPQPPAGWAASYIDRVRNVEWIDE